MTATIRGTPFELVDDGAARSPAYRGPDRRRTRPRVSVCDQLAGARRAAWSVTLGRLVLVTFVWLVVLAPRLPSGFGGFKIGVMLGYWLAELLGITLMLMHLANVARAASRY